MKYLLILLLLPFCGRADGLYKVRTLSKQELLQTYTAMLRDACHFAEPEWKTAAFDPAAGYWGDGVSAGNEGIRTVAGMVLACGTLLKYDDHLSADERRKLLARATAGIRYATATHITGPQKCTDGKHWGATEKFGPESWQSGMWTGTLGFGAWLMWDQLEPELREEIQRVITWEDDILSQREPPTNLRLDTKAEENGWEVPCIVLGELMCPAHPHAAAWHETAVKYMLNTLCTADDLQDTNMVDGQAVNQRVRGANLQPDFTLENHNIFHPSYVACSSYFMTEAAMYYTYSGKPVPQAAAHHVLDTWGMFQKIILPWGESAYPQGMDWELHGLPYLNLFASLAARERDPLAAKLESQILQYARAWQTMGKGNLAFPGSRLGITRHSINAEQISYGLLAHKIFGAPPKPLSASAAATREQGVWEFPYVDFIVHRTAAKFVSFSWKNRIMGMMIPIGKGHEENPDFTVPIVNGLVGTIELEPRGDTKTTVGQHSWKKTGDGFETTGTLLVNGGRLKQTITVTSIGERAVVYQDRVTALTNVSVAKIRGVPVGIENDQVTGGTRLVTDAEQERVFDAQISRPLTALAGTWANVGGRLGMVMVAGGNLDYAEAADYSPGISVRADTLYGDFSNQPRQFKAGDEVARRVAVILVEADVKETAAVAKSCRIEERNGGRVLRLKTGGSKLIEVPLF